MLTIPFTDPGVEQYFHDSNDRGKLQQIYAPYNPIITFMNMRVGEVIDAKQPATKKVAVRDFETVVISKQNVLPFINLRKVECQMKLKTGQEKRKSEQKWWNILGSLPLGYQIVILNQKLDRVAEENHLPEDVLSESFAKKVQIYQNTMRTVLDAKEQVTPDLTPVQREALSNDLNRQAHRKPLQQEMELNTLASAIYPSMLSAAWANFNADAKYLPGETLVHYMKKLQDYNAQFKNDPDSDFVKTVNKDTSLYEETVTYCRNYTLSEFQAPSPFLI